MHRPAWLHTWLSSQSLLSLQVLQSGSEGRPSLPHESGQVPSAAPQNALAALAMRKSLAASVRMAAEAIAQCSAPTEVTATCFCTPSIIAKCGPPESPSQVPVPSCWLTHAKVSSPRPTELHEMVVFLTTFSGPAEFMSSGLVMP